MKKILVTLMLMTGLTAWAGAQFYNTSDVNLGVQNKIKCGAGMSCAVTSGKLVLTSSPSPLGVITIQGGEAADATLTLQADESDDSGDDWVIKAAASGNALSFSNDTSGSQVVKMTLSTGGALSGYKQLQTASTTASLSSTDCGSTIISDSSDVMTLPEASTVLGCRITFVATSSAHDLDINPADGTDTIAPITASGGTITPSAGDAIRLTDAGASVTLQATGNDQWSAISHNGAITDID